MMRRLLCFLFGHHWSAPLGDANLQIRNCERCGHWQQSVFLQEWR